MIWGQCSGCHLNKHTVDRLSSHILLCFLITLLFLTHFLVQSVDWWSLGILMFELLTGASPFTLEGERNSQSEVSKWVLLAPTFLSSCHKNRILSHTISSKLGIIYFPWPSFPPLFCQTYFTLRSTVPLYDWTHCSGPAEEVVGERSPQEAGFWTTRVGRHQSTFLLQGPTYLDFQSLKYLLHCLLTHP